VLAAEQPERSLTGVMMGEYKAPAAILSTRYRGLDLLPADSSLADVNIAMADPTGKLGLARESRLKRALRPLESRYDYVIVDTGPQRTLLNVNVLNYVDEVFVPIDPGYWSLVGVRNLEELIAQIREHMDHASLRIGGVLLTKVQRTNVAIEVAEQVRSYFGKRVFRATIPLNVKVEEAHSRGLSVLDYAPESAGAQAYLALTREVLAHEGQAENRAGKLAAAPAHRQA
jgi:chromosome partitioning protein